MLPICEAGTNAHCFVNSALLVLPPLELKWCWLKAFWHSADGMVPSKCIPLQDGRLKQLGNHKISFRCKCSSFQKLSSKKGPLLWVAHVGQFACSLWRIDIKWFCRPNFLVLVELVTIGPSTPKKKRSSRLLKSLIVWGMVLREDIS